MRKPQSGFSKSFASLLEGCGVLGRRPKSPIAMGEIPFEKSVSARIFHNMKKNKIPAVQAGILHGYTDIYALSRTNMT